MPDLTGKSTHDATQALQQADLKWVFHREATDDTKANAVIRQQPASGTQVKPGTTVDVTVAVPATVEVPKLTGLAKGDALSALERASLKPRVSERPDAGEKPDMVIGQDPAAGTRAKPGSVIEVRVAVADLRTVPDLVGKPQREVVELVRKADLRLKAVKEPTSKYEVGTVLRQEPSAGARVSPGTEVTMFIATGMPPPPSEVPKVTGLPLDEAGARLWRMAGLAVKWDTEATRQYKQGVVTAQNPEAGARVKAGSEVTLTVAVTPNTCIPGYIWREAFPDDRVCVNPQIRAGAVDDNRSARSRLEPDPSKRDSGPDTCIKGLVWREAGPKDHVCVAPIVRTRAAEDNKQAAARVAR